MQGWADVYVQKPISYDVVEGQAMVGAAENMEGPCRLAWKEEAYAPPAGGQGSLPPFWGHGQNWLHRHS